MNTIKQNLITEHKYALSQVNEISSQVYGDVYRHTHPVEYANLCIQLRGYRMVEEALRARLENMGVYYKDSKWLEDVTPYTNTNTRTDCDVDPLNGTHE